MQQMYKWNFKEKDGREETIPEVTEVYNRIRHNGTWSRRRMQNKVGLYEL